jgi:hypothetical protein
MRRTPLKAEPHCSADPAASQQLSRANATEQFNQRTELWLVAPTTRVAVDYASTVAYSQQGLTWWRTCRVALSLGFFMATGGWLLLVRPDLNSGPMGVTIRAALFVVRYLIFWGLAWLLIRVIDPDVLVSSRTGLQTLFQVLPATVVAVLVLILGAVFVIAQIATSTWGTRAPLMITFDDQIVYGVARPLLILVTCLLLSGQVPDEGPPSKLVTAAAAAVILATVRMLVVAATVFPVSIQRYVGPRAFPQLVVADVGRELHGGALVLLVFRTGLLAEMLRLSLRRGDTVAVTSTLEAITDFQSAYLAVREVQPEVREFRMEDGSRREGWLASDLQRGLIAAGEEALRIGASGDDGNGICRTMGQLTRRFDDAGDAQDASRCIDGLTELATNYLQISANGTTNLFTEPVLQLALVEANSEDRGHVDIASHAIAGWALGAAYARYHLHRDFHPMQPRSIEVFGPQPPWQQALELIAGDPDWQHRWANKLGDPKSLVQVIAEVVNAAQQHANRHGISMPNLTPPQDGA